MFHAADHTMSNVMAMVQAWDEKYARINKARQNKGISDEEWAAMKHEARANHSPDMPFLKALNHAVMEF